MNYTHDRIRKFAIAAFAMSVLMLSTTAQAAPVLFSNWRERGQ